MENFDTTKRQFVKAAAFGVAGLALMNSAKSYSRIVGANDRVNFAAVGVNGRGKALINAVAMQKNVGMIALCDVDKRQFEIAGKVISEKFGDTAKNYVDFRELMDNKDVDALVIATPEHWHAPMTIMGVQADKHVYIEKPCSHNPHEGELLVQAQKKYGKIIQMGNQQRSAPSSIEAVQLIKDGFIGEPYLGKAWYANNRASIGVGKVTAVPEWLDWELWQGPAPRAEFKDNFLHYHWHWFWKYGTGEINNNGTHEIDVCRWALGLTYPKKVSSTGGRYHFKDDWQFYDSQVVTYEFEEGKSIVWEGNSCNNLSPTGKGRGAVIYGTKGSVVLERNEVVFYDIAGKEIKKVVEAGKSGTTDTVGAGWLDSVHMNNFVNAIRIGEKQNSPIDEGATSNLLCHLGNYSQALNRPLTIDTKTGRILNDKEAMKKYWKREYEPGWEIKV